jgi:hypothetical protein
VPDPFGPLPDQRSPISGIDSSGVIGAPLAANALVAPSTTAAPTVVIPRKNGPNWIVIGMVVAFGAFGVTAGVAVFFNKQPPPQPAPTFIMPSNPVAPAVAGAAGTNPTATTTDNVITIQPGTDPGTNAHAQTGRPNTGGGGSAPTASTRTVDPSIAALLGGPGGGPQVSGGNAGGSPTSALSEEAIQRVVQQRSAGVKRTCWERGGGTESNVNVRVHLVIAASGSVSTASAEGNDPIVSKCIENSVRNWSFPVSSGATTVDIPFHFLRQ